MPFLFWFTPLDVNLGWLANYYLLFFPAILIVTLSFCSFFIKKLKTRLIYFLTSLFVFVLIDYFFLVRLVNIPQEAINNFKGF